jgi:hypothetical protein
MRLTKSQTHTFFCITLHGNAARYPEYEYPDLRSRHDVKPMPTSVPAFPRSLTVAGFTPENVLSLTVPFLCGDSHPIPLFRCKKAVIPVNIEFFKSLSKNI